MTLATVRCTLVNAPVAFLRTFVEGDRVTAASIVGATLHEDWPGSPEADEGLRWHLDALAGDPRQQGWRVRLILVRGVIVGSINLKGPPDVRGEVEIGWGLVPTMRRRGLATEAADAVIAWAFESPTVHRVIATIPADHERSQAVAVRLGMTPIAELRRDLPVWILDRAQRPRDVRRP